MPFTRENSEYDLGQKLSSGDRNTAGDLDRKFYRLDKFLSLLAEGQSKQVEMLFCPKELYTITSPEWDLVLSNRDLFLSKKAIVPFCRFAKAQSLKAFSKGENLNTFRELLTMFGTKNGNKTLKQECSLELRQLSDEGKVALVTLEGNVEGMELAGRKYLLSQKVKDVKSKMVKLEKEYGSRSNNAANEGYDFKSLSHAYRLLFQAEELLTKKTLTFPLPKEQVEFLKSVRLGEYKADYFTELEAMMAKVTALKSDLPDEVDRSKVDELCQELMMNHFGVK